MERWNIVLRGGQPSLAVAVGAAVAVALAMACYMRKRSAVGALSLFVLTALRSLAIVLVALFLLQPVLRIAYTETRRTHVAVLVDVSGSMRVPDAVNGETRVRAAAAVLRSGPADVLRRLADTHDVSLFTFGAVTSPVARPEDLDALRAEQRATAPGQALRVAVDEVGLKDLSGIVLLSDGIATQGEDAEKVAEAFEMVPIFPVAMGGRKSFPDVGVAGVPAVPEFIVNNEATLKVDLGRTGLQELSDPERRLELKLNHGGQTLVSRTVQFPPADGTQQVALTFVPQRPGVMRLSLELDALRDELVTENNSRSFTVRATDPRIRVLIVEGVVRSEYRFLRRVLESDPNIELTGVIKLSGGRFFLQGVDTGMDLSRGLPARQEDFDKFDVVIMGDIGRDEFTGAQLADLRAFVDAGGGLCVLGGYHSFGAGGYADSPLAEVLPVTMGGESDGHSERKFVPELTAAGKDHLILRGCQDFFGGPGAAGELEGANRVTGAKPGADVLAVHPSELGGADPMPVLAVHHYGTGRVMALAADTTWKWKFRMATRGLDSPYYRFWRQSMRWLAAPEDDADARQGDRVVGWADRFAYEPGEHVGLKVRVKDAGGGPEPDATVTVRISYPVPVKRAGPGGAETAETSASLRLEPVAGESGLYSAVWLPPVAGLYQAVARARLRGREVGASGFEFAVGLAIGAWTARPQYGVGESVMLSARVRGRTGEPLDGARLEAEVEYPFPVMRAGIHGRKVSEDRTTIRFEGLPDTPGEHSVTWRPPAPGPYRVTVTGRDAEDRTGAYMLDFVVGSAAPEFHRIEVDEAALRTLARLTRGRAYTQATAAGIPDELKSRRRQEFRRQEISLWNAPWFFVVLLLCLTAEWLLRKRRALT